jgi:hypothetical protein
MDFQIHDMPLKKYHMFFVNVWWKQNKSWAKKIIMFNPISWFLRCRIVILVVSNMIWPWVIPKGIPFETLPNFQPFSNICPTLVKTYDDFCFFSSCLLCIMGKEKGGAFLKNYKWFHFLKMSFPPFEVGRKG